MFTRKMLKRFAVVLGLLLIIYVWHRHNNTSADNTDAAPVVSVSKVKLSNWQDNIATVGTVKPSQGVTLSAETNGIIKAIYFQSGQQVNAGTLLIELDHQDLDAEAESQQANIDLLALNYQRNATLAKNKMIAQADLDSISAKLKEAKADLNKTKALISQKKIIAPFAGTLGISQVNLGQYLSAGSPVINIETLTPIYVDFNIPQADVGKFKVGDSITITSGNNQQIPAKVLAISPDIDINTRTLNVRAQAANQQSQLIPGMSVNVEIKTIAKPALVIPQSAIMYSEKGEAVYRVDKLQAKLQSVTIGKREADSAEVISGLTANDQVVIAGQGKLHDGATVKLD